MQSEVKFGSKIKLILCFFQNHVFRVGLGLIGLLNCFYRVFDSHFYLEFGVLNIEEARLQFPLGYRFSLNYLSESETWFDVLNFFQGLFSLGLIFDLFKKYSVLGLWVLTLSFQNRNPMVLYGGDVAYRMFLLCYLLSLLIKCDVNKSVLVKLQLSSVYFFSFCFKIKNHSWQSGHGLIDSLSLKHLVTPFGNWLSEFHGLLLPLSYSVLVLELLASFIVFLPTQYFRIKNFVILLLISMHLAILMVLNVGFFSLMMSIAWLPFLEFKKFRTEELLQGSFRKSICFSGAFLIVFVNICSITNNENLLQLYDKLRPVVEFTRIDQKWDMFDNPAVQPDGFFYIVYDKTIMIFGNKDFKEDEVISEAFPNHRWVKVLMLNYKEVMNGGGHYKGFRRWICKRYAFLERDRVKLYFKNTSSNLLDVFTCGEDSL